MPIINRFALTLTACFIGATPYCIAQDEIGIEDPTVTNAVTNLETFTVAEDRNEAADLEQKSEIQMSEVSLIPEDFQNPTILKKNTDGYEVWIPFHSEGLVIPHTLQIMSRGNIQQINVTDVNYNIQINPETKQLYIAFSYFHPTKLSATPDQSNVTGK